jgi:vitamin B12 transporter
MALAMADIVKAEEDNSGESAINLEKIVVTPLRTSVGIGNVSENVIVVNAEQIKALPARDLSEALSYVAGVNIEQRQGFGRATSISIQGADSRQVRVMIDGIPLNSQSSGQVNPVGFPVENIERIEVIKGAGSSMWGSGLGGVINVITKDTGNTLIPKGNVTASLAGFRTKKDDFDVSGQIGELGYYASAGYMESGGSGSRDDVLSKKTYNKLSYDLKGAGKLIASFGYSGADVNSGVFPDGSWQAQPYRNRYGKIGWENDLGASDIKIDLKHSRQDIVTKSFVTSTDDEPFSRIETKDFLYQLSVNSSSHPREKDLLNIGVDFDNDALKSSAYISKAKSVRLYAPYTNYTLNVGPWDVISGLRYDHNSEFGQQLSPSLGSVYHFENIPDTLVRVAVSRAFNAPPLLWKFNENAALNTAANPDIKAERAWVYEVGYESRPLSLLWFKLSLYRSEVRDALDSAENELGQVVKKNFQKFRRQGAEVEYRLKLYTGLYFTGGAAFNDIEDRSTKKTVRGGGKPRQSFDTGLEYKNKAGFTAAILGYYDRWNEPASFEPNDRKMLFDLKIRREWKNFSPFLNVYNLTNSKYWADSFFPVPQRYFEGGVNFKW